MMNDGKGNTVTYDAGVDSCAGTQCSVQPAIALYQSDIIWQVDALSNGNVIKSGIAGQYTTPRSFDLAPVTSAPERCEVWPTIAYDNYIVLDNIWNNGATYNSNWTQSISAYQSSQGFTTTAWNYNWLTETEGDRTAVKAYPEIIYGNKLGTLVSGSKEETGLPEVISALPEFVVEFDYSESLNGSVERNVAIESFFHTDCNIKGPCDTVDDRKYEMMVWVENPESNKPGDLALTGVQIDNRLWDVYIKPRSNKEYIAFTAQTPFNQGTVNWNRFVEWTVEWTTANAEAQSINPMSPNLCMGAIEMGTELWWGQGSFNLNNFKVTKTP